LATSGDLNLATSEDFCMATDKRSAGVCVVRGEDEAGRSVVASGEDPDEVLSRCRADAAWLGS